MFNWNEIEVLLNKRSYGISVFFRQIHEFYPEPCTIDGGNSSNNNSLLITKPHFSFSFIWFLSSYTIILTQIYHPYHVIDMLL